MGGGTLWQETAWKIERKTRGRYKLRERELLDHEYGRIKFIQNIGNFTSLHGVTSGNTCMVSRAAHNGCYRQNDV